MTFDEIEKLVDLLQHLGIEHCEYVTGTDELKLSFQHTSGALPETYQQSVTAGLSIVKAHRLGVFHDRHPLAAAPLVEPLSRVSDHQHIGFIEIEDELHPVYASSAGTLSPAKVAHGAIVGYGDELFEIS